MYLIHRHIAVFVAANIIMTTVLPPPAFSDGWRRKPTSIERLAHSIDRLEKHLDEYGTVVVKSPDVWGEARLTKYRQEYETILESKKDLFSETINATISRSDKAFVTNALALQAAVSSRQASIIGSPFTTSTTTSTPALQPGLQTPAVNQTFGGFTLALPSNTLQVPVLDASGNPQMDTTTVSTSGISSQPLSVPGPADGSLIAAPQFGSANQQAQALGYQQDKIALEPTVMLDQLSRYVNHLHQLRRISDGDDKSDAPGYALHLVRLPVSVLPGKKTREGYGAEVTVIAKPHLHEKLLPETFRGLVINDLVDQWSFPLAKFLDQEDAEEILANVEFVRSIRTQLELAEAALEELAKLRADQFEPAYAIRLFSEAQSAIDAVEHLLKVTDPSATTVIAQLSALSEEIGRQLGYAQTLNMEIEAAVAEMGTEHFRSFIQREDAASETNEDGINQLQIDILKNSLESFLGTEIQQQTYQVQPPNRQLAAQQRVLEAASNFSAKLMDFGKDSRWSLQPA